MKINKRISAYNNQSRYSDTVKYIVIHYVGGDRDSTAKNNVDYFAGGDRQASAHYFVDENEIWQSVEESRAAWHCGGPLQGSGGHTYFQICTNRNSIGIEMCDRIRDYRRIIPNKTIENVAWLVQYLMKKYGIPKSHVLRHFDVTGKNCPNAYPEYNTNDYLLSAAGWERFRDRITGEVGESGFTIEGANYPTVLHKGERFEIQGKVKSAAKLKSVSIVVEKDPSGEDIKEATKKRYTSAKTFDLANIDPYIAFRKLKVGKYRYKIKAEDINGTKVTLLRKPFKVTKE